MFHKKWLSLFLHFILQDTRTYVVQEIYRNEQSYVESLQTVVLKYLKVLKSPENAGMIDTRTVDEIFFMVPDILEIHEKFLAELKHRLDDWDMQQKVGDAFIETVINEYIYLNMKLFIFKQKKTLAVFKARSARGLYVICQQLQSSQECNSFDEASATLFFQVLGDNGT